MFTAPKNASHKSHNKSAPGRDSNAVTILTSGCHFSGRIALPISNATHSASGWLRLARDVRRATART